MDNNIKSFRNCGKAHVAKLTANLVSIPLGILTIGSFFTLYTILPYSSKPTNYDLFIFLISIIPLIVIHEGIHAYCALRFGRLHLNDLKFGMHWKALMPYYHLQVPITVRAYRLVALMPLYITGTISIAIFFLLPTIWSTLLAGTAIASCIGDIWIFIKLRPFNENLLAKDYPSEIGCDILEQTVISTQQSTFSHEDACP